MVPVKQEALPGPLAGIVQLVFFQRPVPLSVPVTDVLTFLTETVTNQSLEYRTLAVYKSAISKGNLPVGQTKLGDLPVVSPTPRLIST